MNILLNTTTPRKGGGLQRAVTFLLELRKNGAGDTWHIATSDTVVSELRRLDAPRFDQLHVFPSSPAKSLASRRQLAALERSVRPDCVFTLAGPAYVKFRAPHLLGYSSPWLTHSTWQAYRATGGPHQWMRIALSEAYKARWIRHADAWVVQTETARQGLQRRLGMPLDQITVVPNTCGSVYSNCRTAGDRVGSRKWRFLCFAAPYRHKRLDLVPAVVQEIVRTEPDLPFEFVLTLPHDNAIFRQVMRRARSLGVTDKIHNEGFVPVADGPALYRACDVCFLPTVLETFSATYPEAMAMKVPIVTTDLAFARNVCGDAALYFRPNDAKSAARELLRLVHDENLRHRLIETGENVLRALPSASEQYFRCRELLDRLVHKNSPCSCSGRSA